jgi:hypothetical protein
LLFNEVIYSRFFNRINRLASYKEHCVQERFTAGALTWLSIPNTNELYNPPSSIAYTKLALVTTAFVVSSLPFL